MSPAAKASAGSKPRKIKSKITTVDPLARELMKRGRKKVVFTNGCFDILHMGHVRYLEEARAQGDILVVALNSDISVRKLKGVSRPLNELADRMEVIAALECVDHVVSFEQDTPLKAILKVRPDVLVKGGDWKVEQIVGGREVGTWGGKVLSLPFVEGKSTSRIIEAAVSAGKK